MKAYLLLENGEIFEGSSLGSLGTTVGEVVFNTSLSGYQEILTDPSYAGQIVTMTYTQIGNYGINDEDEESKKPYLKGFVVKEASQIASNFRSRQTFDAYLKQHNIVGISNIDTRKLTKLIRDKGSLIGAISSDTFNKETLQEAIDSFSIVGKDLVKSVTTDNLYEYNNELFSFEFQNLKIKKIVNNKLVIVIDFGAKNNILNYLKSAGFKVVVVPAYTTFNAINELKPDGVFFSNGPGDPRGISDNWIKEYKKMLEAYPSFGICFGHQIIARCFDLNVYKMKFGHHGGNHPVKDLYNSKISVTAQNHNYAVEGSSLESKGFEVTHINLNDNTVEGLRHKRLPIMSVQYHPEASPGPHDAEYLFESFAKLVQ